MLTSVKTEHKTQNGSWESFVEILLASSLFSTRRNFREVVDGIEIDDQRPDNYLISVIKNL
jgi:hypothetical protein